MKNKGFTLLEVIIYLMLFSLLMTGVLQTVYIVLETASKNELKISILKESTFLQQKLDWLLSGATAVTVLSSTSLSVIRLDVGSSSPLTLSVIDGVWYLQRGSATKASLSSTNLVISDVNISTIPVSGSTRLSLQIMYHINTTPVIFQTILPYE